MYSKQPPRKEEVRKFQFASLYRILTQRKIVCKEKVFTTFCNVRLPTEPGSEVLAHFIFFIAK